MKHLFKHWWQDASLQALAVVVILVMFVLLVDALLRGGAR